MMVMRYSIYILCILVVISRGCNAAGSAEGDQERFEREQRRLWDQATASRSGDQGDGREKRIREDDSSEEPPQDFAQRMNIDIDAPPVMTVPQKEKKRWTIQELEELMQQQKASSSAGPSPWELTETILERPHKRQDPKTGVIDMVCRQGDSPADPEFMETLERMSPPRDNIGNIPREIWEQIISHLGQDDLTQLSVVNKGVRSLIGFDKNPNLYREAYIRSVKEVMKTHGLQPVIIRTYSSNPLSMGFEINMAQANNWLAAQGHIKCTPSSSNSEYLDFFRYARAGHGKNITSMNIVGSCVGLKAIERILGQFPHISRLEVSTNPEGLEYVLSNNTIKELVLNLCPHNIPYSELKTAMVPSALEVLSIAFVGQSYASPTVNTLAINFHSLKTLRLINPGREVLEGLRVVRGHDPFTSVTEFIYEGPDFQDEYLGFLKDRFPNITSLDLGGYCYEIKQTGIKHLNGLGTLKRLKLKCKNGDLDLVGVGSLKLPNLEFLELSKSGRSSEIIGPLDGVPSLNELKISNVTDTKMLAQALKGKTLRTLKINYSDMYSQHAIPKNFEFLLGMQQLEEFMVSGQLALDDLKEVGKAVNKLQIKKLVIPQLHHSISQTLPGVSGIKELKILELPQHMLRSTQERNDFEDQMRPVKIQWRSLGL